MSKKNDLKETIEELRLRKYSHIPKEIVEMILEIEEKTIENRPEGLKKIRKEVEKYFEDREK